MMISRTKWWPFLAIALILTITALVERWEGRSSWCGCGRHFLWVGDICSSLNSQTFLDPYSFTHVVHGFLFCGLVAWCIPRLSHSWRLCLTIFLEALWEIFENSQFVIQRYRQETASLGYLGDTVANSLGDILSCAVGFIIASRLGFRRTLVVLVATEVVLLIWIKDSLFLEVLMLIHPVGAIKDWQMCR